MIKDIKHYEKYDRKDKSSGVSKTKDNENETNIYKKLIRVIQTAYHISETIISLSNKDEGSTNEREAYQRREKGNNRQGERKHNYSQNRLFEAMTFVGSF